VGTAVLVLPLRSPIQLAEEIAMADHLTGGRLDVGIGRGYQPHEFERFGLDLAQSRAMYEEAVDVILGVLQNETFGYQGQHYQVPEGTLLPRPLQSPHPPFYVACQSEASLEASIQRGFHVLTGGAGSDLAGLQKFRNVFDRSTKVQHSGPVSQFGFSRWVCVAESDSAARIGVPEAQWVMRAATNLAMSANAVADGRPNANPLKEEPTEAQIMEQYGVFGSPETCLRILNEYVEGLDPQHLLCTFWLGGLSQDKVLRSMELFAKEVLPGLRQATGGSGE
jgi:alkanesulfonate monooxygenase SsuD/methylene tetrahydromethanopterin reductase-like flavin-dependent oxidoreductase (luciferase family)